MNATDEGDLRATDLTLINILTYTFLCVVIFGIGASVELSALRTIVRERKWPFVVGLLTQYLVMPAAARLVALLLQMPDVDAFGLVLIGCCPGGATSNAFAYFAKADMALSVSMTAVSNALAFVSLPLLLLLWTRDFDASIRATIPFVEIVASLLMVLVPAALGIAIRHFNKRWASRVEKLGAASGAVLILSSACAGLIQNRSTLSRSDLLPWQNVLAVCLVAPLGMLCAVVATLSFNLSCVRPGCERLPLPAIATVVMETGIQNTVLALAILTYTAKDWTADASFRLQLISIMWGLFVSIEAIGVMALFRCLIQRTAANNVMATSNLKDVQQPEC